MERDGFIEVETSQGKEQIHLVQYGQGEEDFLVWHGFDSVNRFCAWKPLLKHGRVTLVGLPGHGPVRRRSWAQCKHWNQAHFVETGAAVAKQLFDNKKLTLIGHSTGALVALGVTFHAAEIVARTVLLNPLIWSPKGKLVQYLVASKLWLPLGGVLMGGALRRKQRSVDIYFNEIDKLVRDHQSIYANLDIRPQLSIGHADYQQTGLIAHLATARVAVTGDYRQVVRDANCTNPFLIFHGEDDPVAPVAQSEWLLQKLKNAQLIKMSGVGHVCYAEREHEFSEKFSAWLASGIGGQGG